LDFICEMAFDSLLITASWPMNSITSKIPGLTDFPVNATRICNPPTP